MSFLFDITLMEEIFTGRNFRGWNHTAKSFYFADMAIYQISREFIFVDTEINNKKIVISKDRNEVERQNVHFIVFEYTIVCCCVKYCSQQFK